MIPVPMSSIYVYDIRSSKWYTQTAGGTVPWARRLFCAGAAWAPDKSSYNIYLYGGLGFGDNSTGFDDIYILSMPSFQWIKYYEGTEGSFYPHHSLTCHVVGGQMLIIGGTFTLTDDCDSPSTWGTHNLDMGKQSGRKWSSYFVNTTSYVVPLEIVAVISRSSLGGATATAPAAGFENRDLSVYFAQKAVVASRTPTRLIPTPTPTNTTPAPAPTSKPKKMSTGTIAGVAVGGAAVLIGLLVGACLCIRRHRRNNDPRPIQYTNPQYSQSPLTPNPPYTPQYQQTDRYEAPGHAPVEMTTTNYGRQDPKFVRDENHLVYNKWQNSSPQRSPPASPHPSMSPRALSASPNAYNSPSPTYSSVRGSGRVPPRNQTYYSP